MQTLNRSARAALCAATLIISGCWMGGNSRSNYHSPPAQAPVPANPQFAPPELGPSLPAVPSQPLEGPAIQGPSFPQSSKDAAPSNEGFDRKRYTHQPRKDMRPNYAGTPPQPVILDGPIAAEQPNQGQPTVPQIGYIELPPAP